MKGQTLRHFVETYPQKKSNFELLNEMMLSMLKVFCQDDERNFHESKQTVCEDEKKQLEDLNKGSS